MFMCLVTSLLWDCCHITWGNEQKLFFIIKSNCWTLSGMEWQVLCSMWTRACIDSAPCSPRRPNPTCHSFAQGIIWSSNRCIFGEMKESGKEALKFPMNYGIALD